MQTSTRLNLGTKLSAQYAFRNSQGIFMACNIFCSSTGSSMPQGHQRFGDNALTTALFSAELPTSDCVNLLSSAWRVTALYKSNQLRKKMGGMKTLKASNTRGWETIVLLIVWFLHCPQRSLPWGSKAHGTFSRVTEHDSGGVWKTEEGFARQAHLPRCSQPALWGNQRQLKVGAEHLPTTYPPQGLACRGRKNGDDGGDKNHRCPHPHPPPEQQCVPGNGYSYQSVKLPAFQQSSSNFKVHLILHQVITDIPRSTLFPELSIWWRTETYWYPLWKQHGCQAD